MKFTLNDSLREIYLIIRKVLLFPLLFLRRIKNLEKKEIRKILFLRYDRIGDMVLSTAFLKALKKGYPLAKLTVIASRENHAILKHNPNIDEMLIYSGLIWFIREMRRRKFDLVIDPYFTHELKQAAMVFLAGGKYRIGFEEAGREVFFNVRGPDTCTQKQMVYHLLDLAELTGGKIRGCEPEIFLNEDEKKSATKALSDKGIIADAITIAIHPSAHYPSQRWQTERFGELLSRILSRSEAKVIILGSSDEQGLLEDVKMHSKNDIQIFPCDSIRDFTALLSKCDLLICNNSGPLHIASALKVPTISIMGPTVMPLWLPHGDNNVVISKSLSCNPCNRAVCKSHDCMKLITVEEVLKAVEDQIECIKKSKKKIKIIGESVEA